MKTYLLTILCPLAVLLAAFLAIRYREVNPYVRIAVLGLAATFVLVLHFLYGDTTQLYGLGILAVAFLFPLADIRGSHRKGK